MTYISVKSYISYILEIKERTETRWSTLYVDIVFEIDLDRRLQTRIYYNVRISTSHFVTLKYLLLSSYRVYISHVIRYAHACSHHMDIINKDALHAQKLLHQR